MKQNYQLILEKTIKGLNGTRPTLLLHSCCGPCSSYVMEYLAQYFDITIFYYNPNISPESEFRFRAEEQERLISEMGLGVKYQLGKYDPERFFALAKGHESEPEGGERCFKCYRLRLEETAKAAKAGSFDYFTTTLSISPHKNAQVLNELGKEIADAYGVSYLFSDFKKKNGYKRSCELSIEYSLYRQDYCGCPYSKLEALNRGALPHTPPRESLPWNPIPQNHVHDSANKGQGGLSPLWEFEGETLKKGVKNDTEE